jgi:hypothetical protein
MGARKRPWGVIAGPIIFFVGLGIYWGVQKAEGLKEQVEDWGYRLEHTAEPVAVTLPYMPLFVDGEWIGGIDTVMVLRAKVGSVDSLRIAVSVDEDEMEALEGCSLRLRVRSAEPPFFQSALACTSDTEGLVPFGHVNVADAQMTMPVMVELDELPCEHRMDIHVGPCDRLDSGFQDELRAVSDELRREARVLRSQAREMRAAIRESVRAEVRQKVRRPIP